MTKVFKVLGVASLCTCCLWVAACGDNAHWRPDAEAAAGSGDESDTLSSVTLWGLSDGQSWLNDWPGPGPTNYPLLFDRELRPKTAFQSVLEQAER